MICVLNCLYVAWNFNGFWPAGVRNWPGRETDCESDGESDGPSDCASDCAFWRGVAFSGCGVPAWRSGVLAFCGVLFLLAAPLVGSILGGGVPWRSVWQLVRAVFDSVAFGGVPECRAGMPGGLLFQAGL